MRFALPLASAAPPPLETLGIPVDGPAPAPAAAPSSSSSYSPGVIIIFAIFFIANFASPGIQLLLRCLSRRAEAGNHIISRRTSSSSSAAPPDRERQSLIDSLPLFSLADSPSSVPKSSPDCAVCLSPFGPHDELRLLPACRHAFHSNCIDTWLASTPSCPLCRSSVSSAAVPPESRSDSFRIEIGSVSRRRASISADDLSDAPSSPSYSLGSSFEYRVDEEVEAVIAGIMRRMESMDEMEEAAAFAAGLRRGYSWDM